MLYPPARFRPVRNRGGVMVQPTRGLIAHVQVGRGSLFGWFDNPASKVSSHLWLSRVGEFEQYVPFDQRAWAQAAGNPYWISCECEGFPSEDYTTIQVQRLAELYAWGIREFGWKAEITDSPDGYGLGTHRMGAAAWGGHECPGPIRAGRRGDILAAAGRILHPTPPAAPEGDVITDADISSIAAAVSHLVRAELWAEVRTAGDDEHPIRQGSGGQTLGATYRKAGDLQSAARTILAEVQAGRAESAAVRAALATMVDQAHPAATMLASPPAAPALLDEVTRLDALGAVRLAHAAASHAASLLTSPAPTGG